MARINCFPKFLPCGKKKTKKSPEKDNCDPDLEPNTGGVSQVNPEGVFPLVSPTKEQIIHDKVAENDEWSSKVKGASEAADYEGGDEQDDVMSMKRDFSDFDLHALAGKEENNFLVSFGFNHGISNSDRGEGDATPELVMQSGHVSDPGIRQTAFWGSPHIKRSCSNIETKRRIQEWGSPTKTRSHNDLDNLAGNANRGLLDGMPTSPFSQITNCSADRVMLKKRSSSQVLPSRSRKLWWKLFLWSHRSSHNPRSSKRHSSACRMTTQEGGYYSDTIEPQSKDGAGKKMGFEKSVDANRTDLLRQNEWIAFSMGSSPQERVNAWVNSLDAGSSWPVGDDEVEDGELFVGANFPNCEIGESSGKELSRAAGKRIMEEVSQANNIIQSLNTTSTVAHMPGIGLKAVPTISAFTSLRAINLSGNLIVQITTGSLPKSLQTLDLSRNKIAVIEGLRELTRLRVLNLSYNRISRIGQGLSNCTVIKELYLAGNKISDVEGLHRLLKLTVLDLSFNKITTAKALGQLVANYNSLLALNLLGNPIQHNIGDDQLRKVVSGLLRSLVYLNKQPIKPQRGRDAAPDRVAKAALGDSLWNSKKKLTRRLSQSSGSSVKEGKGVDGFRGVGSSVGGGGHRNRKHSSKTKHHPTSRK